MSVDTAIYIGEAGNYLANGTQLIPGVTVANIPEGEAIASDLWSPIDLTRPSDAVPLAISDGGSQSAPALATLDGGTP